MPSETAKKTPSRQDRSGSKTRKRASTPKMALAIDKDAIKKINLVAVTYSCVEREWFPNDEAYEAEREVEHRAEEVIAELEKLGIPAKGYTGDRYLMTNLLVDKPDLVLNLVDTIRGKDYLQTSVPAALELVETPYTGAGMRGLVIGNDRNLFKELLDANDIPTPDFHLISRRSARINPNLSLPLIVKLNESGGSVGIDNNAVKETMEEAQEQVNQLIGEYKMPVIVEEFIDGAEITAVAFDDGQRIHIFLGKKKFRKKQDGKHYFTSLESYSDPHAYTYEKVKDKKLANKITGLAQRAFKILHNRDYAKFDVRVDEKSGEPYFTDCNPNTAFGPSLGLPFTEVLALHGVAFQTVLSSLISKHAKKIQ